MKLFEGKSPTERNKIIAAAVLGVLALSSLFYAFSGTFFGSSKTTVSVKVSPTPKSAASPGKNDFAMPTQNEQNFLYTTIPVVYDPAVHSAPDPGRNIFAFYEPAPPCPECPTPIPPPAPIKTPEPTPTPPMMIAFVMPQSVYAGSKGFRLEISGDRLEPDARIYFSQSELPTSFVNAQKITADVPASMIASEGPRQVIVQTPDGKKYSNQIMLNVQAPPKPQFQYIGMIARVRYNNDTAYFLDQGAQTPMSARLNDIVPGGSARFRLISISAEETILEDVNLGFKHKLALYRPPPGTVISNPAPSGRGFERRENYVPYNPNTNSMPQSIPGIPDNIPRYVPPTQETKPGQQQKPDADDNDPDDGR